MAAKVLSIEVGESVTKVIEMDFGAKNPRIYHAFSFETPKDTLSDDGVNVNEAMVSLMRQGLSQNGIRTSKAIFTIESSRIASRDIMIPLVKDNKIKQLLIANSKDYFPVDLTQYELVYRITERLKEEKQIKLAVFAVPHTLITSYRQLAKAWGFQIQSLDYSGNSICQAMRHTMDQALAVTICVNDKSSSLTIVKDGRVELQRIIGYGLDEAVEIVQKSSRISADTYMQALGVLKSSTCLNQQLAQGDADDDDWDAMEDQEIMDIRGAATKALSMLIGNLSRMLDYYTSRNAGVNIEEITLIGLGAEVRGLDKLLSTELGVDVVPAKEHKGISYSRSLSRSRFEISEYMVPVGATYEPLNFSMDASSAGKGAASKGADSMAVPAAVFVICLAVSVGTVGYYYMKNMNLETENSAMRSEITSKQSVVDTYNSYLYLKKTADGLTAADVNASVPNEAFLQFLEEMEEQMPSELRVDTLSVSENIMTLSMVCTSKSATADAIMKIRTFDTILDVSCSGVTETENEAGVKEESFEVTLIYNTSAADTENTAGAAEGAEAIETTEAAE